MKVLALHMFSLPAAGTFFLDKKENFLCYFCLDTKVTNKSRPDRNLSEQPQKFLKKTFFNEIPSAVPRRQISEWPVSVFHLKLFNIRNS
jgi:hypothetical protein